MLRAVVDSRHVDDLDTRTIHRTQRVAVVLDKIIFEGSDDATVLVDRASDRPVVDPGCIESDLHFRTPSASAAICMKNSGTASVSSSDSSSNSGKPRTASTDRVRFPGGSPGSSSAGTWKSLCRTWRSYCEMPNRRISAPNAAVFPELRRPRRMQSTRRQAQRRWLRYRNTESW